MRVDEDDAAFSDPAKPIGSFMDEATARKREAELGWRVKEDAGNKDNKSNTCINNDVWDDKEENTKKNITKDELDDLIDLL